MAYREENIEYIIIDDDEDQDELAGSCVPASQIRDIVSSLKLMGLLLFFEFKLI